MSRWTDAAGGGKHSGTGSVGKAPPLGTGTSDGASPVIIQTVERSVPRVSPWFGEVTVIAHYLQRLGVLSALEELMCLQWWEGGPVEWARFTQAIARLHTLLSGAAAKSGPGGDGGLDA